MILPPYACKLGMEQIDFAGRPALRMPPDAILLGRPGFLHGGALGGMLEMAGMLALGEHPDLGGRRIKPVNISVDYMRGGRMVDTFAQGIVVRLGNRLANILVDAWQDDPARPIAMARMTLKLGRPA